MLPVVGEVVRTPIYPDVEGAGPAPIRADRYAEEGL